jgi:hypothetical protein
MAASRITRNLLRLWTASDSVIVGGGGTGDSALLDKAGSMLFLNTVG